MSKNSASLTGPRAIRARNDSPSRNSIARNTRPDASPKLMHRADAGVIQGADHARLAPHSLQRRRMRRQLLGQELQRYHPAQRQILGLVYHAHGSPPGFRHDPVVRDHRTRNERGSLRGIRLQLADEPVPLARQRLDVAGSGGGVRQRLAQPLHRRVDAVLEPDDRAVRPQARLDLLARDHLARPIQQHGQDRQGLIGHP